MRLISQKDFGTFRQVFLVYGLLAGVIAVSLESSLYYFLPTAGPARERSLIFQTFILSVLFAALISLAMLFGAPAFARAMKNPDLVPLLRIFALFPFLERLMNLIPAFMISRDRAVQAGMYTLFSSAGRIAVVVVVVLWGSGLTGVFWAVVFYQMLVTIIGCMDMIRLSSGGEWRLDRELIRQQMGYIWPLWVTATIVVVNVQFDKLLISLFYDPEVYAIYSCGAIELPIIALITTSVSTALMPNLVTLANQGKTKDALKLWHEGIRKCSLIIFPCFAFFLFVSWDFILLLYGPKYTMATWPFIVFLFHLPIRIAIYATIFRALGKTTPIAVSAGIGLVTNVVFSTGFIWLGGKTILSFIGPSIGSTLSLFVVVIYYIFQLKKTLEVQMSDVMRWKELGRTLGLSLGCSLVMTIIPLPEMPLLIKIIFRAVIFCAIFIISMVLMGMFKKDEKELILLPLMVLKHKWFHWIRT